MISWSWPCMRYCQHIRKSSQSTASSSVQVKETNEFLQRFNLQSVSLLSFVFVLLLAFPLSDASPPSSSSSSNKELVLIPLEWNKRVNFSPDWGKRSDDGFAQNYANLFPAGYAKKRGINFTPGWGKRSGGSVNFSPGWRKRSGGSVNFSPGWGKRSGGTVNFSPSWGKRSKGTPHGALIFTGLSPSWGKRSGGSVNFSPGWGKRSGGTVNFSPSWGKRSPRWLNYQGKRAPRWFNYQDKRASLNYQDPNKFLEEGMLKRQGKLFMSFC